MSDVPENSAMEWEAAQWVARQIGNQPFDKDGFDAWLAGDPRRKVLFDTMWPRITGSKMDAALDAVIRRRRRSNGVLIVASVVTMLVLLGGYQALPSVELLLSRPEEYAATEGAPREVTLQDGTLLTLAAGARVRVRYARHTREVELTKGTIYVDVTHDETRPFRIDAGSSRITDLGTRLEVSSKPSFIRVTVESGAVRFGPGGWFDGRLDLHAGQAAVLDAGELGKVQNVSRDTVARWRTEWVEYDDAPMSQVIADLDSVSPLPIRIAAGNLTRLRVTGRMRLIDPLRQINNLATIHHFTVDHRDGRIVLSDRP